MASLVGQTLDKKYRIDSVLGVGGMGAVYKAYQANLDRLVAIKVMHDHYSQLEQLRARFKQEALTAAQLNHPGIVKVFDFGELDGLLYLVMEFIPGQNLQSRLETMLERREWLVLPQAINLICQVGVALDYAHRRGVLHRDIKSANIMLRADSANTEEVQPIITDLGLAKLADRSLTQVHVGMGSAGYMSPEQANGLEMDHRTDIYSLGVLLYELTVGRLPFTVNSFTEGIRAHSSEQPPLPRVLNPNLPPAVEKIIMRAIEKKAEHRFATVRELVLALKAIPASELTTSVPPSAIAGSHRILIEEVNVPPSDPPIVAATGAAGPHIIEITAPDGTQRTIAMQGSVLTIGRSQDNLLVLDDEHVSRRHAQVTLDGTTARITDLGSSNGSKLEGATLRANLAEVWRPTTELTIGSYTLRLLPPGASPLGALSSVSAQYEPSLRPSAQASGATGSTIPIKQEGFKQDVAPSPPTIAYGAPTVPAIAKRRHWSLILLGLFAVVLGAFLFVLWQRGATGTLPVPEAIAWLFPQNLPTAATIPDPPTVPASNGADTGADNDADNDAGAPEVPTETPTPPAPDRDAGSDNASSVVLASSQDQDEEEAVPPDVSLPLPDLAIASMVITPEGDACGSGADLGLQVVIINKGERIADEFIIEINERRLRVEAGLEPGQTVQVWLPEYADSNIVSLDPGSVVRELHEDNNTMSIGREATLIPTCEPTPTDTPTPTHTPTDIPTPTITVAPPTPTITEMPPTPTAIVPPVANSNRDVPLKFVYVRGNIGRTDIYVYDAGSGESKAVAANPTCDEAEPRWTPAGTGVLYHANCNGSYDIYHVDVTSGNVQRLTQTDQYDEWEPNLSPNGTWLTYRRTPASTRRHTDDAPIWMHNLETGQTQQLDISGRSPIWSPDGKWLLYMSSVSGSWQIYIYNPASNDVELVSTNCSQQCRWPTWLPDSQAISYTLSNDELEPMGIWVAPLGEAPWQWLSGAVGRASWSRTGQVIFGSDDGLEITDFDGNARRVVVASSTNWAPYWNK